VSESRFEPAVFHLQYSLGQRAQSEIEFVPRLQHIDIDLLIVSCLLKTVPL